MQFLKDSRVVAALGAVLFAGMGLLLAITILRTTKPSSEPPPASQAGLVVEMKQGPVQRDPGQEYRCFKAGEYVGMATLDECARRNGVVSGALDVGMDETGALAAAEQFGTAVTPLPPPTAVGIAPPQDGAVAALPPVTQAQTAPAVPRAPTAPCQRYERRWSSVGDMPLNACLQVLFASRCERSGQASYGRWGDVTLRLVPGRIEQSRDDRNFRTLVEQGPGCTIPQL